MITLTLGIGLISCNSNGGGKNVSTKPKVIDSVKNAKELELEQLCQDSIEALQIKGYIVKRLVYKHKYGGVTKIVYQSLPQLFNEVRKLSKKQMWTKEKLQSTLAWYKNNCIGGQIRLYIERITIGSANTDMFSIIVNGMKGNELYRIDLDNHIPQYSSDWWWNYGYAYINKRIKAPFYVYIVDKLEDIPFKFEVIAIKRN
jgi:hypothetical protein